MGRFISFLVMFLCAAGAIALAAWYASDGGGLDGRVIVGLILAGIAYLIAEEVYGEDRE